MKREHSNDAIQKEQAGSDSYEDTPLSLCAVLTRQEKEELILLLRALLQSR